LHLKKISVGQTLVSVIFLLSFLATETSPQSNSKEITDVTFRFTLMLPETWAKSDMKETGDKDAISYSFERNDKKCAIMLLAFKLNSVKNLEDFIYTMEKDVGLNIPTRSGDYTAFDHETYDGKFGLYKDAQYSETIYYYRTKLPDAPNNFVYMLRFIAQGKDYDASMEYEIKKIADSFLPQTK
jgi:hypothetical protein